MENKQYMLSASVYTWLKWVALIALPALGVAYGSLAPLWRFPFAAEIPQTCQILALFIGALIGISQATSKPTESE